MGDVPKYVQGAYHEGRFGKDVDDETCQRVTCVEALPGDFSLSQRFSGEVGHKEAAENSKHDGGNGGSLHH